MDFYEALRSIAAGQIVTKREWGDPEYWGQMLAGQLVLHKPDNKYYPWILSDGDIQGRDWELVAYA